MRKFLIGVYILLVVAGYGLLTEFGWGFWGTLGGAIALAIFAIVLIFLVLITVIDVEFEMGPNTEKVQDEEE